MKLKLADVFSKEAECNSIDLSDGSSCLLIDGMALVAALGRPNGAKTFKDYADHYQAAVLKAGFHYQQIHVVFAEFYQIWHTRTWY